MQTRPWEFWAGGLHAALQQRGVAGGLVGVGWRSRRQTRLLCFLVGLIPYASCPPTCLISYVSLSKGAGQNPTGEPELCLAQGGSLEQSPASGMVMGRCLCGAFPCFPPKTLCAHTYGHRLLNTPPTASPVSLNEHQGQIWSSIIIFELRINISRMGDMLHVSMSDAASF